MFNLAQYLLKHNANPNIQDNFKRTAFYYCIEKKLIDYAFSPKNRNLIDLVNLFLDHNAIYNIIYNDNILHRLADLNDYTTSQRILKHSNIEDQSVIDNLIDNQNSDRDTPACIAAKRMNIQLLRFLITNGADFTIRGSKERTPLEWALWYKNCEWPWNYDHIELMNSVIKLLQGITNANNPTLKEQHGIKTRADGIITTFGL
jgi:ankyrin repeat protein